MEHVTAFLGPAGSGKTYALMGEIERICSTSTFQPAQSILAITFMHGSRRRLNERLRYCSKNGVPTQCETIDSFCLRIINRFRRYLDRHKPVAVQLDLPSDGWCEHEREWKTSFRAIRRAAIELLRFSIVRSSVGFAYPIIVVDEFQDCEDDLLEFIGLLSTSSSVLVAADDFQHLSDADTSPACKWLNDCEANVLELTGNRRTSENVLHETAAALREGRRASSCIEVHAESGHGLVAWHISSRLTWGKIPTEKSKVLISPVRPSTSTWVQGILASLEKELGQTKKLPPRPFRLESTEEEQYEAASEEVKASIRSNEHVDKAVLRAFERSELPIVRMAGSQGRRLASLRGDRGVETTEFLDIMKRASHSASAFRRDRQNARIALTVHGAKNREFDYVFIAWPFKVRDDDLFKRKLLYNAVTRAKEGAFLFVQGGEKRIREDSVLSLLQCGLAKQTQKSSSRGKNMAK
jgi:superfamily I DNA/RNA helicase